LNAIVIFFCLDCSWRSLMISSCERLEPKCSELIKFVEIILFTNAWAVFSAYPYCIIYRIIIRRHCVFRSKRSRSRYLYIIHYVGDLDVTRPNKIFTRTRVRPYTWVHEITYYYCHVLSQGWTPSTCPSHCEGRNLKQSRRPFRMPRVYNTITGGGALSFFRSFPEVRRFRRKQVATRRPGIPRIPYTPTL